MWVECKIFQGFFKNKKEKKNRNRLSFITQFKIESLLLFNGCRKVLGKMPILGFTEKSDFQGGYWKTKTRGVA